jgi:hemolysin activation/secretion protein
MMTGRTMLYRKDAGSDFDAETFMISANRYIPMRENDVLAFRGYFRTTSGSAPFFIKSTFGGSTDLRGYPSGRYRDNMMYAIQGEYRWAVNNKWILTGFAGVGEVAGDVSEFGRNFLPAAGLGARFVVSQKHRVSLSFDVAQGKHGTEYYFGVGEAF